jgi:hypothetical protein
MNRLRQFWHAAAKVFALPRRLRAVRDQRADPAVPTFAVSASLFLGALLHKPSFLQIQFESARPGWQRLIGHAQPITDDPMAYVCERYRLEDWRALLVSTNQTLKRNKAFESAKIHGLLAVALDANEQFNSRCRCCPACSQRQIKVTKPQGQSQEATALMGQAPPTLWQGQERQIQLREVKDLPFTDPALGQLRVVQAQEQWEQRRQSGGQKTRVSRQSFWRWLATQELDAVPAQGIWRLGHARRGIENHAFNELTQHYHLEHCPHHEPVAIVAWRLILVLAFNLFEWFARLHGKLCRAGALTLQELAAQLDRAVERHEELEPLWSG